MGLGLSSLSRGLSVFNRSIFDVDGIDVNPGSDQDAQLITVGVTGTPLFKWDESEDAFDFNKRMTSYGVNIRTATSLRVFTDTAGHYVDLEAHNGTAYERVARIINATGAGACRVELHQAKVTGELESNSPITWLTSNDLSLTANQVSLAGYELSPGNRALAIAQEAPVAVEVDETKFSHKLPVRINGVSLYIMLTAT